MASAPYALDLIGWARDVYDAEGYLSLRIEDRWWTWLPGPDRIWGPFAASPEAVRGWDVPRLLGVPLERIARELGGQWPVTRGAYATLWEGESQRCALYGEVTPCWDGQVCRPFERATLAAPAPSVGAQPGQGGLLRGLDPATGGRHLGFFVPPDRQLLASPSQSAGSNLVTDPQERYASLRRYGRWWALLLDGQGSAYGPFPVEDPH